MKFHFLSILFPNIIMKFEKYFSWFELELAIFCAENKYKVMANISPCCHCMCPIFSCVLDQAYPKGNLSHFYATDHDSCEAM